MYHVIDDAPSDAPFPELYLSRTAFAAQMRYLAAKGFHAVTLQAVWGYWHGARLPAHPIVLSFDDGYRSQWGNAARILRRYHWHGVLNLVIRNLHAGTYGLYPTMVRSMMAAGWEIDSHTINHTDLTTITGAALEEQVVRSRQILKHLFHAPVNFFCYPAGRYNDAATAAVQHAGYLAATTTNYGLARLSQGRYTLSRIRIDGSDTTKDLAAKLSALHVLPD
jgi:peptidoglycan/xylan/chitin deacetylase (PgdA/CDA1 family)